MGVIHVRTEVIRIHFNYDSEFLPVDVSEIYAFQINVFPQSQPIFDSMNRYFNRDDLTFYEDKEKNWGVSLGILLARAKNALPYRSNRVHSVFKPFGTEKEEIQTHNFL